MTQEVPMKDLVVGQSYKLPDDFDVQNNYNDLNSLKQLVDRFHIVKHIKTWPPLFPLTALPGLNSISLDIYFEPDAIDIAKGTTLIVLFSTWMPNKINQLFLKQKSVSNVYKHKGIEFEVRNKFEKMGASGYNPGANIIVKMATGAKYTPNPYARKSRKNTRSNRKVYRRKTMNKRR